MRNDKEVAKAFKEFAELCFTIVSDAMAESDASINTIADLLQKNKEFGYRLSEIVDEHFNCILVHSCLLII